MKASGTHGGELPAGEQHAVRAVEQTGDAMAVAGHIEAVTGAAHRGHEIARKPAARTERHDLRALVPERAHKVGLGGPGCRNCNHGNRYGRHYRRNILS